jgi:hypothetical protein
VVTLRGATGAKNGVKSGGFWQPLSQDVAFCCNVQYCVKVAPKRPPKPKLHCLGNTDVSYSKAIFEIPSMWILQYLQWLCSL